MKTDLFQSCGHCWVFQICWHIECSTFTASSFRIWKSSTGIASPPLALFIMMLPKAHLTSHFRMSGSRWVIALSWLSGPWRSFFLQFFCVFLPPLNVLCFCKVHTIYVLYFDHPCIKSSLGISNFLEEISSLSHSIIFLFLCIDHWGRLSYLSLLFFENLHSNRYIFPFLLCCLLLLFSQLFLRPPQTTILPFCISFSCDWFWSQPPVQCYEPPSIVLQALCLPDLIPWIYFSLSLYNHKGFDLSHTWKMEKLYTVNKNKTRSWLWLRSWTPECQIQT